MMNYDQYFMNMAYLVAMKSKDQRTWIGAVIVGVDNEIISTGFNSFPRGINDHDETRQEKPEKYFWFEHGERNAVYNAARIGVSTKGCKMYTQGIPCAECARACIQAGIIEIIVDKKVNMNSIWKDSQTRSAKMLQEAGVTVREIEFEPIKRIERLSDGVMLNCDET